MLIISRLRLFCAFRLSLILPGRFWITPPIDFSLYFPVLSALSPDCKQASFSLQAEFLKTPLLLETPALSLFLSFGFFLTCCFADSMEQLIWMSTQYIKEFKENAVKYYLDHKEPGPKGCAANLRTNRKYRFRITDYSHTYRLIFEYIEAFYNTVRIHSYCEYHSPKEYEKNYYKEQEEKKKIIITLSYNENRPLFICTFS